MKRYDIVTKSGEAYEKEHPEGEYVLFDDHAAELASLRAKLAESEQEKAGLRDAFTGEALVLAAKLAEWEAAGRVLAHEWNAINYLASCGNHANEVDGPNGEDEGDYRALIEMERSAKAINANPLASRLVAEAGGKQ